MTIPADMQPSELVERSLALARAGHDEESEGLVRAGLVRFPGAAEVHLHAGAAAADRGESAEAKRLALRAVELAPEDPRVLTRAALLTFDLDEFGPAEKWSRQAANIAPDDFVLAANIAHLAGKLLYVYGKDEGAEEMLRMAFEDDPEMRGHGQMLAMLLEKRGRNTEALEVIAEALGHRPGDQELEAARERILAKGTAALTRRPARPNDGRGHEVEWAGKRQEAQVTIPADMQPSELVERSAALVRGGQHEEGEELLRAGLVRFPGAAEVHLHAAAAVARGEPAEAKQLVSRAVELAPKDPGVLTHAASLMFELGELGQAEKWAHHAANIPAGRFELTPNIAHLTGKLGVLYGKDDEAEPMLRMAFEGDPEMPGHGEVLGGFLEKRGRDAEALEVITQALRHRPGDKELNAARERILALGPGD